MKPRNGLLQPICFTLAATSVLAGDPPPPNPAAPVDYVKWINEEFGRSANPAAAQKYADAILAYRQDGQKFELTNQSAAKLGTEERLRKTQEWIDHSRAAIDSLVAAGKADKVFFPWKSESGSMLDVESPDFSTPRRICMALLARARRRAADGALSDGCEDVFAVLRTSRQIAEQPGMNAYVFGLGTGSLAYLDLLGIISTSTDKLDAAAVLKSLGANDRPVTPPRRSILGEKAYFFDVLQRACRDTNGDGKLDSVAVPEGVSGKLDPPVTVAQAVRTFGEVCDAILAFDQVRSAAARTAAGAAHDKLRTLGELEQVNRDLWGGEGMRRTYEALQNGTRAVLYLHAYKAANGKWPETLKDAMTGAPATQRWDPFSDGELAYKLQGGEPLLYSVGRDGKDDGGKRVENARMGERGDLVFWPFEK